MKKKILGLFGDSYIQTFPAQNNWSFRLGNLYDSKPWGLGGSNLYYAIDRWNNAIKELDGKDFDFAIFTLTWHTRLYSVHQDRNKYFCRPEDNAWDRGFLDPEIQSRDDFEKFKSMVHDFHRFLYDDHWARFRHELEIKYIMDLPKQHPNTRFVFIPNTKFSNEMALKHHSQGVLLDFAFEDISNDDPGCPGTMPLRTDYRINHISKNSQEEMYQLMKDLLENYDQHRDQILPVDMAKFHVDKSLNSL